MGFIGTYESVERRLSILQRVYALSACGIAERFYKSSCVYCYPSSLLLRPLPRSPYLQK